MSEHLRRPVFGAIAAAVLTIGLKSAAYFFTGSVGLFSDAAESLVNLLGSVTALASLWYAARPVDAEHTYGHEKIVYFSTGLEGLLIVIAGIGTAAFAVQRLVWPRPLSSLELGSILAIAASAINYFAARWLTRVGRQFNSIVLEAEGQHLMTDVWTSIAVLAGLGLAWTTGVVAIDPVIAFLMGCYILWTGYLLMARAFNGLMDRALPPAEQMIVRKIIEQHLAGGCAYHALRTRQAGPRRFVDFHLLVPGSQSVQMAHARGERIEEAVRSALSETEVTIHIEPIEEDASWHDSELISVEAALRAATDHPVKLP